MTREDLLRRLAAKTGTIAQLAEILDASGDLLADWLAQTVPPAAEMVVDRISDGPQGFLSATGILRRSLGDLLDRIQDPENEVRLARNNVRRILGYN